MAIWYNFNYRWESATKHRIIIYVYIKTQAFNTKTQFVLTYKYTW